MTENIRMRVLPAEWAEQTAILLAWPHMATDWNYMLSRAKKCFADIVRAITRTEHLIIVAPDTEAVRQELADIDLHSITFVQCPTNDTWARDFGPITVIDGDTTRALDFRFNAWGLKFAADKDNLINRNIKANGALGNTPLDNHLDMVLEGGSIDTDGCGTILTTAECLLSPNRNGAWDIRRIEHELQQRLGAKRILWLNHGALDGDDTDSHIDTLARFTDEHTIVYCRPDDDDNDSQATALRLMEEELKHFVDCDGNPYQLVPLPMPKPIYDSDGNRLPATYANFLILNRQVLVPTYNQTERDKRAIETLSNLFTNRTVSGIDCSPLIEQHGSLHCVTMQLL